MVYTADSIRRFDSKTNRTADSIPDSIRTKKNDSQVPNTNVPPLIDQFIGWMQVVLCANSRPALNDVTYNELTILTRRVANISEDLSAALAEGRLLVMESGQGSPCLDLR